MSAPERIPAGQAQKNWKALLDRAHQGERIVITRDGKDVATLGPVAQQDVLVRLVNRGTASYTGPYNDAAVKDILGRAFGSKKGSGG